MAATQVELKALRKPVASVKVDASNKIRESRIGRRMSCVLSTHFRKLPLQEIEHVHKNTLTPDSSLNLGVQHQGELVANSR